MKRRENKVEVRLSECLRIDYEGDGNRQSVGLQFWSVYDFVCVMSIEIVP